MKYTLPNLPFAYQALEPYIDEKTMLIHHTKHHQAYITNVVAALEKHPEFLEKELEDLLKNPSQLPEDIRQAVINHGGGHYNHSLFWTLLKPNARPLPLKHVAFAIDSSFGDFAKFKEAFSTAAKTRFGSGWAWLIVTKNNQLKVVSTANQDAPLAEGKPILALDVWEHAYYLNYQNRRPDYIEAFFHVIHWEKVEELYLEAIK